jgi:hypothetical protein
MQRNLHRNAAWQAIAERTFRLKILRNQPVGANFPKTSGKNKSAPGR